MVPGSEDPKSMHRQNGKDTTKGASGASPSSKDDETLVNETRPLKGDMVAIDDWSRTGRGSHVDFADEEHVPLQQGTFLGRGAAGDVHEVTVQEHVLAHKKMVIKRKLGGKEMKEIDILKRLSSHEHIVQLVGTYTHRQFLGLLIYPVAVCDMATFFEDVEAWHSTANGLRAVEDRKGLLESNQKHRLVALGYEFPPLDKSYKASPVYSKIGCLISATAFLHDQKIRHKDLKPSNILLSKERMWLSDFGSATDFSLLSQSATDDERGTPRYFSPEVAAWQPNGRAADIFSLGCVLLEVLILHDQGTLEIIRENRSADPSFHANTKMINIWLRGQHPRPWSSRRTRLVDEIRAMLDHDPGKRPTAKQLMMRSTGYDLSHRVNLNHSIFGECCRSDFVTMRQHTQNLATYKAHFRVLNSDLAKSYERNMKQHQVALDLRARVDEFTTEIEERRQENRILNKAMKAKEAKQHRLFVEYNRDRDVWLQEKCGLKDRVLEVEAQARIQKGRLASESTLSHDEANLRSSLPIPQGHSRVVQGSDG